MKTRNIVVIELFILALFFSGAVRADSLSELNVEGFKDRVSPGHNVSKNPFLKQRPSPEDILVTDLSLTGIIKSFDESYALISGYTLAEGDEIAGYKVKVIEKDHVVLRRLDEVKVLRLE